MKSGTLGKSKCYIEEIGARSYQILLNGRLTQLGECFPYKEGVVGSSPTTPTIRNSGEWWNGIRVGLRNRFRKD